jgi:hypothetical protein
VPVPANRQPQVPGSSDQFTRALEFAEKIQEEYDRISSVSNLLILLEAASIGATSFLFVYDRDASSYRVILAAILFVTVVLSYYVFSMFGRWKRERALLFEIVRMLHETERAYSADWSPLERTLFQMRLARLDIGRRRSVFS